MTPFVKIVREATMSMEQRFALLQQPCEFYRQFFQGRLPSLDEKMMYVEQMVQRMTYMHIYENNLYHVEIMAGQPFIHLDIARRDGGTCKNWRHFQHIKNELIGPEHEAMQLFPSESRLVDAGNEYHLWVYVASDFRFPVGFSARFVLEEPVRYTRYTLCDDDRERTIDKTLAPDSIPGTVGSQWSRGSVWGLSLHFIYCWLW